jgi:LacI family transcriptional regulator
MPTEEKAGHTNTVLGFGEACRRCAGAEVRVARHDGTPRGLRQCLDTLRHEVPPTGLLVALPSFIVGTVTELIAAGVQVGREVSVIGRDSDAFLEFVVPSVARYAIDVPLYVQKLSRLVLTTARGGVPSKRDTFLVPEFVPGHSLGAVSASGT